MHGGRGASPEDDDDDATYGDELPDGLPTCSICLTNPVDTALRPCFHASFCEECAGAISTRRLPCPICRGQVTGVQRVYL